MIKKIRTTILNFMMAGSVFGDGDSIVTKGKKMAKQMIIDSMSEKNTTEKVVEENIEKEVGGTVYEAKSDYISKVSEFLQDGVKQMKKDLL